MKKDTEVTISVGIRSDGSPKGQIKFEPIESLGKGTVRVTYADEKTGDVYFTDLPRAEVEELAKKLKEK